MDTNDVIKLVEGRQVYNTFCQDINEGDIIYNLNKALVPGEYLLVISKIAVNNTWALLMLGMSLKDNEFVSANIRFLLTADMASYVSYLKKVGHADFDVEFCLNNTSVNNNLTVAYKSIDIWKYSSRICSRKPRRKKYGKEGYPIVKKDNSKIKTTIKFTKNEIENQD